VTRTVLTEGPCCRHALASGTTLLATPMLRPPWVLSACRRCAGHAAERASVCKVTHIRHARGCVAYLSARVRRAAQIGCYNSGIPVAGTAAALIRRPSWAVVESKTRGQGLPSRDLYVLPSPTPAPPRRPYARLMRTTVTAAAPCA
jgi:hypothetical protein